MQAFSCSSECCLSCKSHLPARKRLLLCLSVRLYSYFSSAIVRIAPSHAEGILLPSIGCARSSLCIHISVLSSFVLQVWVGGFWLQHCRLFFSKSSDGWIYIPSGVLIKLAFKTRLKSSFRFLFFFFFLIKKVHCVIQPISPTAL